MHSDTQTPAIQALIEALRTKIGANCLMVTVSFEERRIARYAIDASGDTDVDCHTFEDSICAHVHDMAHPLVVDDARTHPLISKHPMVLGSSVGAFAGFPVYGVNKQVVAVMCALFDRMHGFSAAERSMLEGAAQEISEMMATLD